MKIKKHKIIYSRTAGEIILTRKKHIRQHIKLGEFEN